MEIKCCKRCGKNCWIVLAIVGAVILVGCVVYYYYFVVTSEPKLTYADIEILCEDVDLLDEAAAAEREVKLQLIYNAESFTESELTAMLPFGCYRVEKTLPREPGSCLVLEEKYCEELVGLVYQERNVLGLNLPGGVPIFAPADGAYFDNFSREKVVEDGEELTLLPTRIEFWLPNSSSHIYFDGLFQEPLYFSGKGVSRGDVLTYTAPTGRYLDEDKQFNLIVIYSDQEMYKILTGGQEPVEE